MQRLRFDPTGGTQTAELQVHYSQDNLLIKDFIDFDSVMPHANVYVNNGGYSGPMLALKHQLPMVAAGVHEGKNEITAHIGYFNVGVNLRTETPTAIQVRKAVAQVLGNAQYKATGHRLGAEFRRCETNHLCVNYLAALLQPTPVADAVLAA